MKTIFTKLEAGAKFSPAEMHLAARLRTLKSAYSSKADKDEFIKHMSVEVDGKAFTKAECERLFKAMHVVAFYDKNADARIPAMDDAGRLLFKREYYANNSNFFEDYAKQLLEEAEIIAHKGRPKGFTSPAIQANLAKMRAAKAAKAAKKAGTWRQVPNGIVDPNGRFYEDIFTVDEPEAAPEVKETLNSVADFEKAIADQEVEIAKLEAKLIEAKETLCMLQIGLDETRKAREEKRKLFDTLSQMAKEEGYELSDLVEMFGK